MIRAAIYARYSSDNQREESIMAQVRAAKEYCKKKDYTIVREFTDEAFTARTDNRPAFQRMITDAQNDVFDVLIVHKIDRFARDRYDDAHYKRLLKLAGVSIEFVEQNIDGSPEGVMMESLLVGMAEYYSKNLSREVKKGLKENALQGKHTGGTPPLGYDVDDEGHYVINEAEAEIVRKIFYLKMEGRGYLEIVKYLQGRGYRTKRGGEFGKNSICDLLKNKKYIGVYTFGRVSGGHSEKRNSHKDSTDMIVIEGAIPAIIDKSTFQLVQNQFTKRAPAASTAKEFYYLSGLIVCGECGAKMVGARVTSRGNKYVYYRCDKQQRNDSCGNSRIKKDDIESAVFDYIAQSFAIERIPELTASINKAVSESCREVNTELECYIQKKKVISKKINNLLAAIEDMGLNAGLKSKLMENQQALVEVESMIQAVEAKSFYSNLTNEEILKKIESFSLNEKTPEQVRSIVSTVIQSVVIKKDEIDIILRFSLEWWRRGKANSCRLQQKKQPEPLL